MADLNSPAVSNVRSILSPFQSGILAHSSQFTKTVLRVKLNQ
jgi:hypothetical protein